MTVLKLISFTIVKNGKSVLHPYKKNSNLIILRKIATKSLREFTSQKINLLLIDLVSFY
jgi:hypothetical protein